MEAERKRVTFEHFGRTLSQEDFYEEFVNSLFKRADNIINAASNENLSEAAANKQIDLIRPLINAIEEQADIIGQLYLSYVEDESVKTDKFVKTMEDHMRTITQAYVDFYKQYAQQYNTGN